jgi:hypothetical protein
MKNLTMLTLMTMLLTCTGGLAGADDSAPLTPELAAKKEMVRKQQEQKITPEKRKAAADALKAERIKVYKAKEAAGLLDPAKTETAK